jgi:hypothetical protein
MSVVPKFYDLHVLDSCKSDAAVNAALDALDIPDDAVIRTEYLHRFMDSGQGFLFDDDGTEPDAQREYVIAKQQLITINRA